jgi:hypothetical protein
MMTSRERVDLALSHREPDLVPLDQGGSAVTGMHVSSVYLLRQALGLDAPGTPVRIIEPYQMLGEIAPDLLDAIGVDVVGLVGPRNLFGFANENWKPWILFDGTPVLVPEGFNTEPEPSGDILMYPEGDKSAPPSGRMPQGGFYFDSIIRQPPLDDAHLDIADNLEEFGPISDADLAHFASEADRLSLTGRALLANFGGTGFGDIALVPAMWLKHPRGIRDVEEWYLARLHAVVGEKASAVFLTGTDFGTQNAPFISTRAYRDLFAPFHKALNDWVHAHTTWRTFIHSCGAVVPLIPDFLDAGFDILNPVQCSAAGMDAQTLKSTFGDRLVFWGGGVDTQRTLPFGTPEDIRREVHERLRIFGPGGGFVFNTIHNVQARTPAANLVALYEAFRDFRAYPL